MVIERRLDEGCLLLSNGSFTSHRESPSLGSLFAVPKPSPSFVSGETGSIAKIPVVNDTTWDSCVMKADGPVLVDFWAPWCGPCKMIDPLVNELAQQYMGNVKFYKLNTDESPATPGKFGVRSIPTIMIFVNGEKDTIIGAVPRATLTSSIDKFLQ